MMQLNGKHDTLVTNKSAFDQRRNTATQYAQVSLILRSLTELG